MADRLEQTASEQTFLLDPGDTASCNERVGHRNLQHCLLAAGGIGLRDRLAAIIRRLGNASNADSWNARGGNSMFVDGRSLPSASRRRELRP
jgi:hypothetical protein